MHISFPLNKYCEGSKKANLDIDYLAFADDPAIFAEDAGDEIELIDILNEVVEKTGLQISFQKAMFLVNRDSAPNNLIILYGRVTKVNKFKYPAEISHIKKLNWPDAGKLKLLSIWPGIGITRNLSAF